MDKAVCFVLFLSKNPGNLTDTIVSPYHKSTMQPISDFHHLKKKWLKKKNSVQKEFVKKHKEILHHLAPKHHLIGTLMLASTPFLTVSSAAANTIIPQQTQPVEFQQAPITTNEELSLLLKNKLPDQVQPLTTPQETDIATTLSSVFHMKVSAQLEGIRLDRSYGIIGKEQHLRRYPGDTIYDQINQNSSTPISDGLAPGLGAWGYFAPSKEQMTQEDNLREKYYIAVQTFLAPGWNENIGTFGKFFRYRKMLVVNPDNGKAIVTDIGDAGPAPFTGKHLGGSPEVMQYLDRVDGAQRGPVIYLFIDDPHDTIPLGPITL